MRLDQSPCLYPTQGPSFSNQIPPATIISHIFKVESEEGKGTTFVFSLPFELPGRTQYRPKENGRREGACR